MFPVKCKQYITSFFIDLVNISSLAKNDTISLYSDENPSTFAFKN